MTTKPVRWWVKQCLADKGDQENPLGSNNTKYGVRFGWNKVAWCVIYGWCKYQDAGVQLPVKTASCVVLYDASEKAGLRYDGTKARPGDAVIRTWQHLHRHSPGFNPEQTHFQEVLKTKRMGRTARHPRGVLYLGLWGGNQGAGYVGPSIEWVPAADTSILGALAFRTLFSKPIQPTVPHNKKRDDNAMPAAKSHPDPRQRKPSRKETVAQTKRHHPQNRRDAAAWRRLVRKIKRGGW